MRKLVEPKDGEALFDHVVTRFSADASVTPPSGGTEGKFGASGLKVGGKLFVAVGLPGSRRSSRR